MAELVLLQESVCSLSKGTCLEFLARKTEGDTVGSMPERRVNIGRAGDTGDRGELHPGVLRSFEDLHGSFRPNRRDLTSIQEASPVAASRGLQILESRIEVFFETLSFVRLPFHNLEKRSNPTSPSIGNTL
ncbi:MAG: hypothetical protein P8020_22085 [Acidobacteriota bacterium]